MLRRVREDGVPVSRAAANFGVSRPTWYQAQRAFEAGGLPGLLPTPPVPRGPRKFDEEVVEALNTAKNEQPVLSSGELVELMRERFGVSVHRRSIKRALAARLRRSARGGRETGGRHCARHARGAYGKGVGMGRAGTVLGLEVSRLACHSDD